MLEEGLFDVLIKGYHSEGNCIRSWYELSRVVASTEESLTVCK